MAKRTGKRVAVELSVYEESDGTWSIEVAEWRAGQQKRLVQFLDVYQPALEPVEIAAIEAACEASVRWALTDGLALDSGRMV